MTYIAPVLSVMFGVVLAGLYLLSARLLSRRSELRERAICWLLSGLSIAASIWLAWGDPYFTADYAYFEPPRSWLPFSLFAAGLFLGTSGEMRRDPR